MAAVAEDTDVSFWLPVAGTQPSSDPPLLFIAPPDPDAPGVVTVKGLGMTRDGGVYIAIYDEMGARLYESLWVKAEQRHTTSKSGVSAFDAKPVMTTSANGIVEITFTYLCGANVMLRACDSSTQMWSYWVERQPNCDGALNS